MLMVWKRWVLAAAVALMASMPAWAISLEEAARKVAREHDARVLSAKTVNRNGRRIHEIKIVTKSGVVKTVRVPEDSS